MEMKTSTILAMAVSCLMLVQTLAIPMVGDKQADELSADKRPKYMDTRDISYFKDIMLVALDELISEGKVSPSVLVAPTEEAGSATKRGHLGICVSLTSSGYKPRPCWKNEGRR